MVAKSDNPSSSPDDGCHGIPKIHPLELNSHHTKVAKQTMEICTASIFATTTNKSELMQSVTGALQGFVSSLVKELEAKGANKQSNNANACKAAVTTMFGIMCSLYFDDVEDIMTCLRLTLDKMGYNCIPVVGGSPGKSAMNDIISNPPKGMESLATMLKKLKAKLGGTSDGDDLFDGLD